MLAAFSGLLKTTKDQLINHYHKGKRVTSLCHVTHSLYLVGSYSDGLILWNEQTDQLLSKICDDTVLSIKRVMTTNNYVIKTWNVGVKVVTMNDLVSLEFSVNQLLDANEEYSTLTDSLQLQITNSYIMIAATQNVKVEYKWNRSIKLMKVPIVSEM
jgi:hypothetical protein